MKQALRVTTTEELAAMEAGQRIKRVEWDLTDDPSAATHKASRTKQWSDRRMVEIGPLIAFGLKATIEVRLCVATRGH